MDSDTLAGAPGLARPATATVRERAALRRRLRFLRKRRELQLRDLGGLVYEMHRRERRRPELVEARIAELAASDAEIAQLEELLDDQRAARELREPGVGGSCQRCGAYYASDAAFCSACGVALGARTRSR